VEIDSKLRNCNNKKLCKIKKAYEKGYNRTREKDFQKQIPKTAPCDANIKPKKVFLTGPKRKKRKKREKKNSSLSPDK
jgi:hypothetical protein